MKTRHGYGWWLGAAAILGTSLTTIAHAAPPPSDPGTKSPAVPQPGTVVAAKRVEVEVLAASTACGSPYASKVKLSNKMGEDWSVRVDVIVLGVKKSEPVNLANGEVKVVDVTSAPAKVLDCTKAAGAPVVEVWNAEGRANSGKIFGKALHPTTIKMAQLFTKPPMPPTPKVWLRRAGVIGRCGSVPLVHADMSLMASIGTHPQPATVHLAFGGVSSDVVTLVGVNTEAEAKLPFTTPLDCQTPTGIPTLNYTFADPNAVNPMNGSVSVSEIAFEA